MKSLKWERIGMKNLFPHTSTSVFQIPEAKVLPESAEAHAATAFCLTALSITVRCAFLLYARHMSAAADHVILYVSIL